MIYLILLGITFFIQLLTASWYVLVSTSKSEKEAFKYKLLCSGIYIADTLLCAAMADAYTNPFYYIVLGGMFLTFTGDILQSKLKSGNTFFCILRALSCICFAASVVFKAYKNFSLSIFKDSVSVITVICILLLLAFLLITDKSLRQPHFISLVVSGIFLACSIILGVEAQKTGVPSMQSLSFILITGSSLISVSDYLRFGTHKEKKKLLSTNLYLFGLMIFSCSIACN